MSTPNSINTWEPILNGLEETYETNEKVTPEFLIEITEIPYVKINDINASIGSETNIPNRDLKPYKISIIFDAIKSHDSYRPKEHILRMSFNPTDYNLVANEILIVSQIVYKYICQDRVRNGVAEGRTITNSYDSDRNLQSKSFEDSLFNNFVSTMYLLSKNFQLRIPIMTLTDVASIANLPEFISIFQTNTNAFLGWLNWPEIIIDQDGKISEEMFEFVKTVNSKILENNIDLTARRCPQNPQMNRWIAVLRDKIFSEISG